MKNEIKTLNFKKIDAFATSNSEGNPAGYIKLDPDTELDDFEMQKLARELKGFVNEVGFMSQTRENVFELKFYSSEKEVDFCGHAVIAILYDLLKSDVNLQKKRQLTIHTNRGTLAVENRLVNEDAVFIMSPVPVNKLISLENSDIAENLDIKVEEIDSALPVSIINAGLTTLLVPLKSLDSILKLFPEFETLKRFCIKNQIDIIEVFTPDVSDASSDFRARVFAPTFGYLEDFATGSGNSALGYYLLERGLFAKDTITIEQNGERHRFNIVKLQKQCDDEGRERILFGGSAITRIQGTYFLYD